MTRLALQLFVVFAITVGATYSIAMRPQRTFIIEEYSDHAPVRAVHKPRVADLAC